ncbi:uncharacterized protein N0V96_003747 [Colletotrichum fioriniae]|uniref:uncharacterized protein n=1 Tax=Colletotrichum fioriniae TaxID=710243 RepID=UPI0032DA7B7B|nr:hypothetical protein N0V96_003747 [Colletotrichum fioriniae]
MAYFEKPPVKEIWHFEVDGNGGGTWSKVPPLNATVFKQLVRSTEASFTQSKEVGYYFGGFAGSRTDTFITDEGKGLAIPGLISFNMTSGEIRNTSSTMFGQYGTLIEGSAQFVPFGSSGLVLFLGGGQSLISFFFYGGRSINRDSISGEVYVLSLPGFVFFKTAGSSVPRADHTCVVVAGGGRQMLSIGGTDGSLGFPKSLTNPDPWKLGLAIFDMTELRWSDRYDSQAQPYESPNVVKQWYAQAAPDNSTSDPSPTGESSATSTAQASQSSKPPTGTIVGAAVGGVAGLVLVACLAVFLLRRQKRYQAAPQQEAGSGHFEAKGPAGANALHEVHTDHFNPVELPAEHGAAELSSAHGVHELEQPTARPFPR